MTKCTECGSTDIEMETDYDGFEAICWKCVQPLIGDDCEHFTQRQLDWRSLLMQFALSKAYEDPHTREQGEAKLASIFPNGLQVLDPSTGQVSKMSGDDVAMHACKPTHDPKIRQVERKPTCTECGASEDQCVLKTSRLGICATCILAADDVNTLWCNDMISDSCREMLDKAREAMRLNEQVKSGIQLVQPMLDKCKQLLEADDDWHQIAELNCAVQELWSKVTHDHKKSRQLEQDINDWCKSHS